MANRDNDIQRSPSRLAEREQDTQERVYRPPSYLPVPQPREGKTFRWVREGLLGAPDSVNMHMSALDGWVPVRDQDVPELKQFAKDGGIKHGGLTLHWADASVIALRDEYYKKLNAETRTSINQQLMQNSDPRMPILKPENQTHTVMGRRNK